MTHHSWKQYHLRENESVAPQFNYLDFEHFKKMLTFMVAKREQTFEYDGELLHGRGCTESTIKKIVTTIDYIHQVCGAPENSPTKSPLFDSWNRNLVAASPGGKNSALSFDVAKHIGKFYIAKWHDTSKSVYYKTYEWAMFLFALWFATRPSELGLYCPHAENVVLDTVTTSVDSDGFPSYCKVGFHDWKSRRGRDVQLGPFWMILRRNKLNTQYCPLFWLLVWLKKSGIKSGPIFPRWDNRKSDILSSFAVRNSRKRKPESVLHQS